MKMLIVISTCLILSGCFLVNREPPRWSMIVLTDKGLESFIGEVPTKTPEEFDKEFPK